MILLTGASGFIGEHLLDSLIQLYGKEQVVTLTSTPRQDCVNLLHKGYSFDDNFFLEKGLGSIHTVIHAGAFTPKSGAETNDIQKSNSNILSTTRLITSTFPNIKKFIFLSTLDVYGHSFPITEDSPIKPASLYGHSKFYCEGLVSAWASQKRIIHQVLRVGHVYGPGEEEYQKIIPVTMKRLVNRESVQIYGEGNEVRSFIYISDVIDAILASLRLEEFAGPINIVSEEKITIRELINKLVSISGVKTKIEKVQSSSISRDFVFNNHKMKQMLVTPKVSLDKGLSSEWSYLKKNI